MKKNKLIAFALSLCLTVGLVPSIAANAATKDTRTTIESSQKTSDIEKSTTIENEGTTVVIPTKPNSEIKTAGVKSKVSKTALKLLAKGIRYSSKAVKKLSDELGGKAGKWVAEHSDDLADVLDDVVAAGDFVEAEVLRGIANGLRAVGAPSSVADTIANVIVWVFL